MLKAVIVGAGARGNRVFAELMATQATGFETVGVVEPDAGRRTLFQSRYDIPHERAFPTLEAFLEAPRFADVVFICTPDVTHYAHARAVSGKGYTILLEKPIATNLPDCLALLDVEATNHNRIFVAHVLRYSPFFRTVRDIIRSGRLGRVQHIHLTENVAHWHYAHSYVRGNWNRHETSGPIVLTKSSHDLDLLHWLMGGERVEWVLSYGVLKYFRPENAPSRAAERCVECPLDDACLFSATAFYLNERDEWPFNVIAPAPDALEDRRRALEQGSYGRCVWHHDNDVCDEQTVLLEFEGGTHAVFGLHAHTADNTRRLRVLFDHAELEGDLREQRLTISHFTGRKNERRLETVPLPTADDRWGHGGGDLALLRTLHDHLTVGGQDALVTSLRSSLTSHVLAFLAEDSRLNGNVRIPVPDIFPPESLELPDAPTLVY
ncbi:MAG: Gfo/Idh/MocA family oxidoreductase [Gemmatimonadota bacterium]|jgi:predicted dehydrogenase